MKRKRIIGFDVARAYAILGMYIVNYHLVFGNTQEESFWGNVLHLFDGNSAALFVILSGMGIALMSNKPSYSPADQLRIQTTILKRGGFLFLAGMLLYTWWSGDILHFYGAYLSLAGLLIFLPKRYYLWIIALTIVLFHMLLLIIPYETGWDFTSLEYLDFWTLEGFIRNTFYNGWNPVFPWFAYFLLGMYLGRLDWDKTRTRLTILAMGFVLFISISYLQSFANSSAVVNPGLREYILADYLPPFFPFMLSTSGFSLMILVACMYVGDWFDSSRLIGYLAKTGQMTFTHYVGHLTIGLVLISIITGIADPQSMDGVEMLAPFDVLLYASIMFILSILFSAIWSKRFGKGPLEWLMRKVSD